MNALIAYYSWAGNTRGLAELIQKEAGGALFEIKPQTPYTSNYSACTAQAKKEIQAGYLPDLEGLPDNLDVYDTVFVGTPNWWSTIAPPVSSFLSKVDLTGKAVAPFCTHGGGGQARCASDTAGLCGGANVLDGLAVYGGSSKQADVSRWFSAIGLKG